MFVEYMAIESREEAERMFDAATKMKPSENDEIYLVKEQTEYQVVLRPKNKTGEQRWLITLEDKGVRAKRVRTKEYFLEQSVVMLSGILCLLSVITAFFVKSMTATFIWAGLVFLLIFLVVTWRRNFQKSIALKIYLIRMI